jgi:glyoxylase-like metal-dependent hydrolase (beta-lactamase superfamily II)
VNRLRELAPGVLVATSDLYLTNSTLIVHEDRALLIDPAVLPSELEQLADEVAGHGIQVELGFGTHAHWDHVLWPSSLASVPRFAAPRTIAAIEAYPEMTRGALREVSARWYAQWDLEQFAKLRPLESETLSWSGPHARVIVHDAHAPGHAALHFPELELLVAGDMVSDVELPGLDWDQPYDQLQAYLGGLNALGSAEPVRLFIPGHGRPGDGDELRRRLDADRTYIGALERGANVDDPRLEGPPPMRAQHDENVRRARESS